MEFGSNYEIIGVISLGMFFSFAAVAAWKLYTTVKMTPNDEFEWSNEKFVVQVSLWLLGVVEVVNSVSLWLEDG